MSVSVTTRTVTEECNIVQNMEGKCRGLSQDLILAFS